MLSTDLLAIPPESNKIRTRGTAQEHEA